MRNTWHRESNGLKYVAWLGMENDGTYGVDGRNTVESRQDERGVGLLAGPDLTTFLGMAASGLWNLVGTPRVLTRFSISASGESGNIWRFHGKTGSRGTNLF